MNTREQRPSICVIGAGLTGLVCAWELARKGFAIQLVEQHSTAGGMLSSMRLGHEYIELLPHHIRKSDRNALGLFKELGLLDEIEWYDSLWYGKVGRKKLGYATNGFHSLISALTQEITDRGGMIHYGYTAVDITSLSSVKSETAATILDVPTLPAGDKSYPLGLPISNPIFSPSAATSTSSSPRFQISCVLADCTTLNLEADSVMYSASCRNFAHISHDLNLPTDYRDALMDVTYKANMCLMLLTKTQINGCFSRPIPFSAPFQRMIEHTNLVGEKRYGGHVVFLFGSFLTSHPLWTASDAEVFADFFKHLQLQNPSVRRSDILTWRLTRTRYSIPTSNSSTSLLSPIPGLYVGSMAMIGNPEDDKTEYRMDGCIAIARQLAKNIEQDFSVRREVNAPSDRIS